MTQVIPSPLLEAKNATEVPQPTAKVKTSTSSQKGRFKPHPFSWHFQRLAFQFLIFALIAKSVHSLAGKCHSTYRYDNVSYMFLWVMHLAVYSASLNLLEKIRYYGCDASASYFAESCAAVKSSVTSSVEEIASLITAIALAAFEIVKRAAAIKPPVTSFIKKAFSRTNVFALAAFELLKCVSKEVLWGRPAKTGVLRAEDRYIGHKLPSTTTSPGREARRRVKAHQKAIKEQEALKNQTVRKAALDADCCKPSERAKPETSFKKYDDFLEYVRSAKAKNLDKSTERRTSAQPQSQASVEGKK
ncbi:MAG: hypothetical protein Q9174_003867 [Haloplaca sp. 1 TL-2023]